MLPFFLIGIVLLMTISEIVVSRPVFASRYNWFHLWTDRGDKVEAVATRASPPPSGDEASLLLAR
jgi:hypothetical protein